MPTLRTRHPMNIPTGCLELFLSRQYGWYMLCISYDAVVARVHCWRNDRSEFLHLLCLLIDKVNELSQNSSENKCNLKLLKGIQMWSSK